MSNGSGESPLDVFGPFLARYRGTGNVRLHGQFTPCTFELAQSTDGHVVAHYDPGPDPSPRPGGRPPPGALFDSLENDGSLALSGQTDDGRTVTAAGDAHVHEAGRDALVTFRRAEVRVPDPRPVARVRYGITNCVVLGARMPLSLRGGAETIAAALVRLDRSDAARRRMAMTKLPDVAAEIEVGGTAPDLAACDEAAGTLCHVLSVARGTVVQWLYRVELDDAGAEVARGHMYHVTRAFTHHAVIQPAEVRKTREFVEAAYPAFLGRRARFQLDRGPIASYLEAKKDSDYLETRSIKAVAAMEMMKAVYLEREPAKEYSVPAELYTEDVQKQLGAAMRAVLAGAGFNGRQQRAIASRVRELHRRSFEAALSGLFEELDLRLPDDEVELFIRCRNNLIHRGRFYAEVANEAERRECPPRAGPYEEYEFLVSVLDRVYLRMLGYAGPVTNWRGHTFAVEPIGPGPGHGTEHAQVEREPT